MEESVKCCFCDRPINYMNSHNPNPANSIPGKRCCIYCNYHIVLPARSIISALIENGVKSSQIKTIDVPDYSVMLDFELANQTKVVSKY